MDKLLFILSAWSVIILFFYELPIFFCFKLIDKSWCSNMDLDDCDEEGIQNSCPKHCGTMPGKYTL